MNDSHDAASGAVSHPIAIRRLTVYDVARPTPGLARIVVGGSELEGFVSVAPDDYIRAFFPDVHSGDLVLPAIGAHGLIWPQPGPPPPARHLTVCGHDANASTLQLDVVLHDGGVGSNWAAHAHPGQTLGIGGPRESYLVQGQFEHYLLVADETGLPALARWLRELPARTAVTALIEVDDSDDEQDLDTEATGTIRWLHRARGERLDDAVRGLNLFSGQLFSWVAAEARVVQAIRHHLALERGFRRHTVRARSYWSRGIDGDELGPDT